MAMTGDPLRRAISSSVQRYVGYTCTQEADYKQVGHGRAAHTMCRAIALVSYMGNNLSPDKKRKRHDTGKSPNVSKYFFFE